MATQKQIKANRGNAQQSTGPRSEEGKSRVAFNALKHGLTAKHELLPDECLEDREAFTRKLWKSFNPTTPLQAELAHDIIGCLWRLRRVRIIDAAIYQARAHEVNFDASTAMLRTLRRYSGDLANLSRHETALSRRLIAMLHEFQRQEESEAHEPVEEPELTSIDVSTAHEEHIEPTQQFTSEPAPAKVEPDPTPVIENKTQVSFFITNSQKHQLRERGYSESEIAQMRPAEAHKILGLV
jgi:hypothetical protein